MDNFILAHTVGDRAKIGLEAGLASACSQILPPVTNVSHPKAPTSFQNKTTVLGPSVKHKGSRDHLASQI